MPAHDNDHVFVNLSGEEVAKDDPAVQTRYTRADFKALDKAGFLDVSGTRADAEPAKVSAPAAGGGEDEDVRAFSEAAAKGAKK